MPLAGAAAEPWISKDDGVAHGRDESPVRATRLATATEPMIPVACSKHRHMRQRMALRRGSGDDFGRSFVCRVNPLTSDGFRSG